MRGSYSIVTRKLVKQLAESDDSELEPTEFGVHVIADSVTEAIEVASNKDLIEADEYVHSVTYDHSIDVRESTMIGPMMVPIRRRRI